MSRSVPEWVGKTDDSAIPPRVRIRVFEAAEGKCQSCSRKIGPADKWQADHIVAVVNGGANSEDNLQCLCDWCHKAKTREDVAAKAKTAAIKAKHLGIRPPSKLRSAPFPSRPKQASATRPLIRRSEAP